MHPKRISKSVIPSLAGLLFAGASLLGCSAKQAAQPTAQDAQSAGVAGSTNAASVPAPSAAAQHELQSIGIESFSSGVSAPDFSVTAYDGSRISLSKMRGKIVLVNFWATWCPPCRAEMPSMDTMYRKLAPDGLELVAMNVQEDKATIAGFQKKEGQSFSFPIGIDPSGRVAAAFGVRGIPTTYVIGKNGEVLGRLVGGKDWAQADVYAALRQLIGDPG